MRYLNRIDIADICDNYQTIIGWGTGPIFRMNYRSYYFKIDFLIDGTGKTVGEKSKGIEIKPPAFLEKVQGKVLVIIYAIYEREILNQIRQYDNGQIDVIIYCLLDIKLRNGYRIPEINGKGCEDLLLISLINQLGLDTVKYLEIGVCHPIMRNNTYMLYEQYGDAPGYKGVLVEANPLCWPLIEEYREKDILIKAGISGTNDKDFLPFYMFPHLLGHSTFSRKLAEETIAAGYACEEISLAVKTINRVIEENFEDVPDILALDAEGLDYEILNSWDAEKYPFKIVVSEIMNDTDEPIDRIMEKRDYQMYARTLENTIWIKNSYKLFV